MRCNFRMPSLAAPLLAFWLGCSIILTSCGYDPIPDEITIVVFGDSLTEGYKLDKSEAFPAQLEKAFHKRGYTGVKVINEGRSGDTTLSAYLRVNQVLAHKADIIIVELGANDLLRRITPTTVENNLSEIVKLLKADGTTVMIAGVDGPLFRLGFEYATAYTTLFNRVAKTHDVAFYPNFLEDVLGEPELNQDDELHPNADGMAVIAENMVPELEPLIHECLTQFNR